MGLKNEVLCPYCGKIMMQGAIVEGSIGMIWLPKDEKSSFYSTRKGIESKGGIVLDTTYLMRNNNTWIRAYACKDCRKVIIDY